MKYVLALVLTVVSLLAQIDKKETYGQVKSKNADLYSKPYECSKKKENYFKKGDVIEIKSCNKYKWCKTKNGYVKKDSLRLPDSFLKQPAPVKVPVQMPKKTVAPKLKSLPVLLQANKRAREVTQRMDVKPLDAYDKYFSEESTKVTFLEKK